MSNASDQPFLTQDVERVHRLAAAQGFALAGIAAAAPSEHAEHVRDWIAAGRHGQMHYLAEHLDVRLDPARLLPGARSIIAVADFYPDRDGEASAVAASHAPTGRVARYAWGDDYHKHMKKRLHHLADALREAMPGAEFRCVVDTAPLLEREHAQRAGLGWVGKHTLLIHPRLGSWMLLGAIVTTQPLQTSAQADYPLPTVTPADHCGTCTRCIDACPTGCIEDPAITGRRSLDATRCISYLTLEHREVIDESLHEAMGDWVAGCDVCQAVCPFNRHFAFHLGDTQAPATPGEPVPVRERYSPRAAMADGLNLLELLGWSAEDRQRVFQGSALKRMKLEMVKRNALIAAGNALLQHDDAALRARITTIAQDATEHDMVRRTAEQVLSRAGE